MTQIEKARRFAQLHVSGTPLVLYNAWDAGSAKAIVDAGAPAVATGSWSLAAAQGYADGENIPERFVEQIVARITASVDVPVSIDFEGGYTDDDTALAQNISRLLDLGVTDRRAGQREKLPAARCVEWGRYRARVRWRSGRFR